MNKIISYLKIFLIYNEYLFQNNLEKRCTYSIKYIIYCADISLGGIWNDLVLINSKKRMSKDTWAAYNSVPTV